MNAFDADAAMPMFGWPQPEGPLHVGFEPRHMRLVFDPDGDPQSPWVFDGDHVYVNTMMRHRIPSGSRTDLASIPRIARVFCNPNGRWQRAAGHHDDAYRRQTCTRFQADAMFRTIMAADGVPWLRSVSMYYAVRFFGWIAWAKNRRRLLELLEGQS